MTLRLETNTPPSTQTLREYAYLSVAEGTGPRFDLALITLSKCRGQYTYCCRSYRYRSFATALIRPDWFRYAAAVCLFFFLLNTRLNTVRICVRITRITHCLCCRSRVDTATRSPRIIVLLALSLN